MIGLGWRVGYELWNGNDLMDQLDMKINIYGLSNMIVFALLKI